MKKYLLFLFILCSYFSEASQFINVDGVHFETGNFNQNGSIFSCENVEIGLQPKGSENFKPLITIKGSFSIDTSSSVKTFSVGKHYTILFNGNDTLSDVTGTGSDSFSIDSLLSTGVTIYNAYTQKVNGADLTPEKIKFANDDTNSTTNSYLDFIGNVTFADLFGLKIPLPPNSPVKSLNGTFSLDSFTVSLNSSFNLKSAGIKDAALKVKYNPDDTSFSIFGSANFVFGTDTLGVNLGIDTMPGIKIVSGKVSYIGLTVNNKFSIKNLTMEANNISLLYDLDSNYFKIYGGPVNALINKDTLTLNFYDKENPGIIIKDGKLERMAAGFSNKMKFGSCEFKTNNLNFEWLPVKSEFVIFGGPIIFTVANKDSFNVLFGTSADSAGIVIQSGKLKQMMFTVNDSIAIGGTSIQSKDLTFNYNSDSSRFAMWGGPTDFVLPNKQKFTIKFGSTPDSAGLIIQDGKLKQMLFTIEDSIAIGGTTIQAKDLTFNYNSDSSKFAMWGGPTDFVLPNKQKFSIKFGSTPDSAGLIIQNGKLKQMLFTVNDSIAIGGTSFQAKDLTFNYNSDSAKFAMWGGPTAFVLPNKQRFSVKFGSTPDSAGLIIKDGKLKQMLFTVNDSIAIGGTTIQAKDLTFFYNSDSSKFAMWGGPATLILPNKQKFSVKFGSNKDSASLIIKDGKLKQMLFTVNDSIEIGGAKIQAKKLTFNYNGDSSRFAMWGGPTTLVLPNKQTFSIKFGSTPDSAGLIIQDGKLKQMLFTVSDSIAIGGTTIQAKDLTFNYNSDSSRFAMWGGPTAFVLPNKQKFSIKFGSTPENAGLIIQNGKLKQMLFTVDDSIAIGGTTIQAKDLTFNYNSDSSRFAMWGGPTAFVLPNKQKFSIKFGSTPENAGLIIQNGKLKQMLFTVNDSIAIGGTTIQAKDLTFLYNDDSSKFAMWGGPTAFVLPNKQKFSIKFGSSPDSAGLIIQNGKLKQMLFTVNDSIAIGGTTIQAKDLTFNYNSDSSKFAMWGGPTAFVLPNKQKFSIKFGSSPDSAGLIIQNGKMKQMIFTVNDSISIGGVTIQSKDLTFLYKPDSTKFVMWGGPAGFSFKGEKFFVKFGENSLNPGLSIKDGKLQVIYMSISGDLTLAGLKFQPKNLTFKYVPDSSLYQMWGGAKLTVAKDTFELMLGQGMSTPGLIIKNGTLKQLMFAITSDINIGGLQVKSNGAGMMYLSKDDTTKNVYGKKRNPYGSPVFALFGGIKIKTFFTAGADAGTMQNPGIYIITDGAKGCKIDIDTIQAQIANVDLGAFSIRNASFGYSKRNLNVQGMFDIAHKFSIGSRFKFTKVKSSNNDSIFTLSSIDLVAYYDKGGIPIGTSGAYITYINTSLTNIDQLRTNPSSLTFTGTVGISFGQNIGINHGIYKTYGTVELQGTVTISGNYMSLTADGYVIAEGYFDPNTFKQIWNPLLAHGTVTTMINWKDNNYYIQGMLAIPANPGLLIDGKFALKNNTISFLGSVTLQVPSYIPVIGNQRFSSVNGALLMSLNNPQVNFAASWVTLTLNFLFYKTNVAYGVKLNFGSDPNNPNLSNNWRFSLIDATGINNVQQTVKSYSSMITKGDHVESIQYKRVVNTFELDTNANASYCFGNINFKTPVNLNDVRISVRGPNGELNTALMKRKADSTGYELIQPGDNLIDDNSSCKFFFGNSIEYIPDTNWNTNMSACPGPPELMPGLYEVSTFCPMSYPDSINVEAVFMPSTPMLNLQSRKLSDSVIQVDAILWNGNSGSPQSELQIFVNDTNAYTGDEATKITIDNSMFNGNLIRRSFFIRTKPIPLGKSYHFYGVLFDSTSGIIYSNFSDPIDKKPDIYGFITDSSTGNPVGNLVLYIDDNNNGKWDSLEVSAITDDNTGAYYFNYPAGSNGFNHGPKQIRLKTGENISNYQLIVTENSPFKNPAIIEFRGEPIQVDFIVQEIKQ